MELMDGNEVIFLALNQVKTASDPATSSVTTSMRPKSLEVRSFYFKNRRRRATPTRESLLMEAVASAQMGMGMDEADLR